MTEPLSPDQDVAAYVPYSRRQNSWIQAQVVEWLPDEGEYVGGKRHGQGTFRGPIEARAPPPQGAWEWSKAEIYTLYPRPSG